MKKTYRKYLKSGIFMLAFFLNVGFGFQEGGITVESGMKTFAYTNEQDNWNNTCSTCGAPVDYCYCYIINGQSPCSYCGSIYCSGQCQWGCQYCGDPYCYGNCIFSYSCGYCGDPWCYGECQWGGGYACYYCYSPYCSGECQYSSYCPYCGSSSCSGQCMNGCQYCGLLYCYGGCQNYDEYECGPACLVCGGSLGGSLRSGRLRTGSSCSACICSEDDYNTGNFALTESLFALLHPVAAAEFNSNATKAENKAAEYGLPNIKNGEHDAFRHVYWCALNVVSENVTLARQAGYAHENTPTDPPQTAQEREMDLYNNEIGYSIGSTAKENGWHEDKIVAVVLAKLYNGQLYILVY